jgi:D-alanyl-D-alanine carboxypeptidase/D-alanyl-D-alanine carboxypeptidase (penicillin-binding protein 5/6)
VSVAAVNEKVRSLGLVDTSFANPTGLDDPKQYSTVYDLSVMGASLLKYPQLRTIVGTRTKVIESSKEPGHVHGWFRPTNMNGLLGAYAGVIGVKPGYTEDAGFTLVGAAERDGRTLVCVTLNSRVHVTDCARLLEFGFRRAAELAKALPTTQKLPVTQTPRT